MVQADLWDKDSVVKALEGTQIVFGVTNFWDSSIRGGDSGGEVKQGKILVDAAKQAGVKFFVWRYTHPFYRLRCSTNLLNARTSNSSLPNASHHSKGKYTKVVHFDGEAQGPNILEISLIKPRQAKTKSTNTCWSLVFPTLQCIQVGFHT
jgi:hypothetical protein